MSLSPQEILLNPQDLIVSKTNPKGQLTYANRRFMEISGYSEAQLIGKPHNIIRHPDMPKAVYRLMWQTLQQGKEFFGFVKNRCADERYYWVFANITPDYDRQGTLQGYFSVRRQANTKALSIINQLYQEMLILERSHASTQGIDKSLAHLNQQIQHQMLDYDTAMQRLYRHGQFQGGQDAH